MKQLRLLLLLCVFMSAEENLYSLLKANLTQKEYITTLQSIKRKGLMYCINTFKSDDKASQDMLLAQHYISISQGFVETFYQQYPKLLSMKNGWSVDKTSNIAFEYIKRYINSVIPFMAYYQIYTPYNKFPIPIQKVSNIDYINSFFEEPIAAVADYFIPCMQLYDSKEYQDYIIRVINFIICKNCKSYKAQDIKQYHTMYDEIIGIAKMQGFARCMVHYQTNNTNQNLTNAYDKTTNDIQNGYFLLSQFLSSYNHRYKHDNITQEVDLYIHNTMQNNTALLKSHQKSSQQPYTLVCLELYDSKEYQDEVECIVKKYCKDCK